MQHIVKDETTGFKHLWLLRKVRYVRCSYCYVRCSYRIFIYECMTCFWEQLMWWLAGIARYHLIRTICQYQYQSDSVFSPPLSFLSYFMFHFWNTENTQIRRYTQDVGNTHVHFSFTFISGSQLP